MKRARPRSQAEACGYESGRFGVARILAVGLALLAIVASAGCSSLLSPQPSPSPSPVALSAKPESGGPAEAPKPHYFPERPITLLVASRRGSKPDFAARLLIPELEKVVGQPVVVVNREGGDGLEAWTQLKQAKPDGYTLALVASPQIQAMALDPWRTSPPFAMGDFVPLVGQAQDPGAIFVSASSPFKSFGDLLGAAKAQPDGISVSIPGGSIVDSLAVADVRRIAGVKLRVSQYLDSANALMAALGRQTEAEFGSASDIAPSVRSGQGRFLAVMDEKRLPDLPEVPTLREKGIDVVSYSNLGYVAPKGTAGDVVAYLAWAIYLSTSRQGYQAQVRDAGLALRFMGGEQYGKLLSSQAERVKLLLPLTR